MDPILFRGRFEHTIDDKGRLAIPARFRDVIAENHNGRLIITNLPYCLVIYTPDRWEILESKASRLSTLKSNVQGFLRYFYSGATECEMDKQGRVLVPPTLRKAAELDKHVVMAGMLHKIEIWSRQRWDEEIQRAVENFDQIAEELADFGL
ncbi:cell division protein MraZ [bacterium BMS3Abin14]|nr:cell division protein MraZ [bacterium BMS3Abin14]